MKYSREILNIIEAGLDGNTREVREQTKILRDKASSRKNSMLTHALDKRLRG